MTGNGRSGRKRKPALVRKLEGRRGHRPIPREAAGRGTPQLPEHLTAAERVIWTHVVTTMPRGIVAGCDDLVLEGLCVQAARFRGAERQIKNTGMLVKGADGGAVTNPLVRISNQANALMMRAGIELGLSPAARTKLAAAPEEESDPMALLLGTDGDEDPWSTAPKPRH